MATNSKKPQRLTPNKVKSIIKKQEVYNIDFLNQLSSNSGIPLMTINFWWNAIKN